MGEQGATCSAAPREAGFLEGCRIESMAPMRFKQGAALAVVATIGFQICEEAIEPPDLFHPHTHQEDHSPSAMRMSTPWIASGANSITSTRNLMRFGPRPAYPGLLLPWDAPEVGDVEWFSR